MHSLDAALSNVATSRARRHTLLLADPDSLRESRAATGAVAAFLAMLTPSDQPPKQGE